MQFDENTVIKAEIMEKNSPLENITAKIIYFKRSWENVCHISELAKGVAKGHFV